MAIFTFGVILFHMSKQYYPTVGLEIHAELNTQRKMFCACLNNPDEEQPNTNICPVCMAHPGTLPVPNLQAIEKVVRVGLALGSTIADFTEFDRKNYFYPDIPKGYQISQYKYPIVSGGHLADFDITRVHLEEDTGTNQHGADSSLVDFNRAGVPLMELVTEPVTFATNAEAALAASRFAKEYQLLLQYLGVSEANMEKGEFRVEANISIAASELTIGELRELYLTDREKYFAALWTKTEVKNLNSFKSVEKAIHYELDRMRDLYEEGRGEEVVQETRGWDEAKQITVSQRKKENAADYRYFPDPDIPKYSLKKLFGENFEKVAALPELPEAMRTRYKESYGIKPEDIEVFINDKKLGVWFESMVTLLATVSKPETFKDAVVSASNFTTSDLVGIFANNPEAHMPDAQAFATVVAMYKANELSSRAAKDLILRLTNGLFDVRVVAEEEGLIQKNDPEALRAVAKKVIDENPTIVQDFKAGKDAALMGLVGRVMKETKGSANPELTQTIIRELLS